MIPANPRWVVPKSCRRVSTPLGIQSWRNREKGVSEVGARELIYQQLVQNQMILAQPDGASLSLYNSLAPRALTCLRAPDKVNLDGCVSHLKTKHP